MQGAQPGPSTPDGSDEPAGHILTQEALPCGAVRPGGHGVQVEMPGPNRGAGGDEVCDGHGMQGATPEDEYSPGVCVPVCVCVCGRGRAVHVRCVSAVYVASVCMYIIDVLALIRGNGIRSVALACDCARAFVTLHLHRRMEGRNLPHPPQQTPSPFPEGTVNT